MKIKLEISTNSRNVIDKSDKVNLLLFYDNYDENKQKSKHKFYYQIHKKLNVFTYIYRYYYRRYIISSYTG